MALLFLLFFFALLHYPSLSFATDTISASQSLSWRQNITSEGGKFVLGFFSPPGSSSGKYYVGIWYNKISLLTPVWVANREIPLTDPATAELKISHDDGNLVLLSQSRTVVWSSNIASISANSTVAVILDNGNLELRDASNSSRVFWQSFDYPSDTWLSGSRLGINKVTNRSQYISSWKNKDDPAPGMFSLQMDPLGTSQFFLFWNLSTKYWATGIWDGKIFTLVPEMSGDNPIFKHLFQHINDSEGHFFTYAVPNGNITTRLAVDYASGRIQALTWMEDSKSWMPFWARPAEQCSVHALCGPFGSCNDFTTPFCNCVTGFRAKSQTDSDLGDRTGGCVRNTPLQCSQNSSSNSEEDGFFEMPNVKLPENSRTLAAVRSLQDCESACLKNCSCTAFSYSAGGCLVWYGDFLNLQEQYNQSDGSTFHLRLAASELQSSEGKKEVVSPVIIGVVVAAAVLACLAVVIWIIMGRRGRSRQMIRKSKVVGSSLVSFTYSEMQHFTKNFSEKIGGGGFGSVFKGTLSDSTAIAVKKLEGFHQGEKQFRTEVSTIGTIQHVNLVRLLGFCSERSKRLLVYEFMPNGSLNTHLLYNNPNALDWKIRYQIAVGTARGLAYLHEKCRDCIIHCDIKPENILLDASFVPKVADFGLAKLIGREFSRVLTTMRGTRGYLAPEWITGVPITAKADVYSYGMVLFEIIAGRRNMKQTGESGFDFFPTLATSKLVAGDLQSLMDEKQMGDADLEELERACKLACWCIQDDENCRPTMGQAVQVLEGILEVGVPPVPRSLNAGRTTDNVDFYELPSEPSS